MPALSIPRLELFAVENFPLVTEGDDIVALVLDGLAGMGEELRSGDVVVLAQKIVSKAEGRTVRLNSVVPSPRAMAIAASGGKDPRLVELILSESARIVRHQGDVLIVEHRLGFVMANGGIDQSNVGAEDGEPAALLLPVDPDASAARCRDAFNARTGRRVAVIINDSFGRPWRLGVVGVAIGCAGLPALVDRRGQPDLFGRPLKATMVALADEIAAAASLLMGQGNEAHPAIIVRGAPALDSELGAAALVRPAREDLFR